MRLCDLRQTLALLELSQQFLPVHIQHFGSSADDKLRRNAARLSAVMVEFAEAELAALDPFFQMVGLLLRDLAGREPLIDLIDSRVLDGGRQLVLADPKLLCHATQEGASRRVASTCWGECWRPGRILRFNDSLMFGVYDGVITMYILLVEDERRLSQLVR